MDGLINGWKLYKHVNLTLQCFKAAALVEWSCAALKSFFACSVNSPFTQKDVFRQKRLWCTNTTQTLQEKKKPFTYPPPLVNPHYNHYHSVCLWVGRWESPGEETILPVFPLRQQTRTYTLTHINAYVTYVFKAEAISICAVIYEVNKKLTCLLFSHKSALKVAPKNTKDWKYIQMKAEKFLRDWRQVSDNRDTEA